MSFIWSANLSSKNKHSFRQLVSEQPFQKEVPQNQWFLFRKQFSCEEELASAITKITVDGRYQLFINGNRVSRGPIRCDPEFLRYDEIDIVDSIITGVNAIAVLVHVYGKDVAWYQQSKDLRQTIFGNGGLFFETILQPKKLNQEAIKLESDTSWKWLRVKAWQQETPQSGWGQGFIEKFDATLFPENWLNVNFDDSDWSNAEALIYETTKNEKKMGWNDISPFPVLIKNDLNPLTELNVYPSKIVSMFQVEPNPELEFSERLYQEKYLPFEKGHNPILNAKNLLDDEDSYCEIKQLDNQDVAIVVEFDKLYTGYPFIELEAAGGECIEIAVSEKLPGEYTTSGIFEKRIRVESHLDCHHLFSYTAKTGSQRFEKFEWTAVKYLQIVIRNISNVISIKNVGVNSTHYPLVNEGQFNCSDDFYNRLWAMGRYTTLLCSHDAWEDCPSREKRQWIGDGLIHYPVAQVCFGNSGIELDKLYLHQAAESQRTDGLLQMFAPGDHHYHGIVIPDFSLHWVSTLFYYLWNTNDTETVIELFPTVQKILHWFYLQTNQKGMIENLPHWHFIEWADMGRAGQSATINALFAGTLKHAIFIANYIGFDAATDKMKQFYSQIVANLNENYFEQNKKVYTDWIPDSENAETQQVSQHTNALMIYYGLAPKERWQSMLDYICNEDRVKITATPPVVLSADKFNLDTDVVKCNTYYSHFLYGALAKSERFKEALKIIESNYSVMLNTNTSTLWESFAPDASLCHAFSASPVYFLSKEILGVTNINPGFSSICIEPKICDLNFAKGLYPTIHGAIEISWQLKNNSLEVEMLIPKPITAELKVPKGFASSNDQLIALTGQHSFKFKRSQEDRDVREQITK